MLELLQGRKVRPTNRAVNETYDAECRDRDKTEKSESRDGDETETLEWRYQDETEMRRSKQRLDSRDVRSRRSSRDYTTSTVKHRHTLVSL